MKNTLEEVMEETDKVKEKLDIKDDKDKDKGKAIHGDDVIAQIDPLVVEEPFLKTIKDLSGKALEGVPLFSGKMAT